MKSRMKNFLNRILYDPVLARVFYDLCISFFSLLIIYLLFDFFLKMPLKISIIIFFPIVFIGINYFLGLYSKYKMSSTLLKAGILSASIVITGFTAYILFHGFGLPLILSILFIIFGTIIPRYFLNFHLKLIKNIRLQNIVLDNAPVLVIGGAGYIGTHLVKKLLEKNYKVRVFDKFLYGKDIFKGMKNIKNLELLEGDIADVYGLTMALKDTQAVIHLAGIVGDPAALIDAKITRYMNVSATRMIKESVKAFRIPRFIFASTCAVYGSPSEIVTEESAVNPLSIYAQTKFDAEEELLKDTFDDFHPTILRFTTVFGHSPKMRFDLAVNLFVAKIFNNEPLLLIGNGLQWRPFIHVEDVAESIMKTLEAPIEKVSRQIFNVGDDTLHLQIKDVMNLVKKTVGKERKVKIIRSNNTSDRGNYRVSFKKIKDQLNFQSSINLEMGIKEIFQHFKKSTYTREYTDPYYSSLEAAKVIKKEFYAKKNKKKSFSPNILSNLR